MLYVPSYLKNHHPECWTNILVLSSYRHNVFPFVMVKFSAKLSVYDIGLCDAIHFINQ